MVSAVLQTAFLGDMILTTPLLERLAALGPVHVVATPANAGILANHPAVTSVIVFDKRRADRGVAGMIRVARALKATRASRAFLAQGSLRTAAIARMAGIPERIGFSTSPGRVLYTRQVRFDATLHHAQRLWRLASAKNSESIVPTTRPSLYPGATDVAQVDALFAEHSVDSDSALIALAPGSVWATKRWPSFNALADLLVAPLFSANYRVLPRLVVLGGVEDKPLATAIASAVEARGGAPVIDATGQLSLLASAHLLTQARLLVTNDSAPLHLASATNTPTVALFGPTVPAFGFGPLASRRVIVQHEGLSCRPCGAHGPKSCPLGHWKCMREISAEQVYVHVKRMTLDG